MQSKIVIGFADAETPQKFGFDPGYVLEQPPNPPVSLQLFRNGILQRNGAAYTVAGYIITPQQKWDDDDILLVFYRF